MSLHQPIKMPVSVFSSEDDDAPQLSQNGAAGEIKTILKACLITGYGSTTAQGDWEMAFEDGNKAVFKSTDPRATGFFLKIDNAGKNWANVDCYEEMTSIDSGTNNFFNQTIGFANNTSYRKERSWRMFAISTMFILVTDVVYQNKNYPISFAFGDVMSMLAYDEFNCFLYGVKRIGDGAASAYTSGPATTQNEMIVSRNYLGAEGGSRLIATTIFTSRKTMIKTSAGHLSFPLYFLEAGNPMRLQAPFFVSNLSERISPADIEIAGRKYHVTNLGTKGNFPVYFIPQDFWYI